MPILRFQNTRWKQVTLLVFISQIASLLIHTLQFAWSRFLHCSCLCTRNHWKKIWKVRIHVNNISSNLYKWCFAFIYLLLGNLEWWAWNPGQCTSEAHTFPLSWTHIPEIMIFFFLMNLNQLYPAYSASLVLNSRFSVSVWLPSLLNTKKIALQSNPCLNQTVGTFPAHLFLCFFVLQICHGLLPSYVPGQSFSKAWTPSLSDWTSRKTGACFSSSVNQQLCDRESGGLS